MSTDCKQFHRADPKLYASREVLTQAIECDLPVVCTVCKFSTVEMQNGQEAVFAGPPNWFAKIIRNMSGELFVVTAKARR